MRFKEFIAEKRKVKEPDWHEADYQSGYADLSSMKGMHAERAKSMRPQLFVPKRRDPAVVQKAIVRHNMWKGFRQIEDEDRKLKEETAPVLTHFNESPPGDNKPNNGFWTSSAIKEKDGYATSDWYQWVRDNQKSWQTDYGFLFEVVGDPIIFDLSYAESFYDWCIRIGRVKDEDYDSMSYKFPWNELAKHFDGAYYNGYSGGDGGYRSSSGELLRGWDVESTVWFKTKFLRYQGAVKLWNGRDEDE